MELTVFLVSFAIFFLLGMPIAAAMISSSFLYCFLTGVDLIFMGTQMFTGIHSFVLIAIPLFILTAEVMTRTTVGQRIFDFCNALVGYIPGGLAHVNVTTSIIFAGMSGSAVADVGGIGHLAYQNMVDRGFDKEFSACVTIASSTMGPIIPPSIPAVVYAMVANVSVGRLLFGGVVPGFLMGLLQMIYIYFVSIKRGYPKMQWAGWRVFFRDLLYTFLKAFLPILTPVILLASIYTGVVTSTEAAALAVLYALVLGFILYRTMDIKAFAQSLKSVFISSGAVLLLLPAAKVFGFVLTRENLQAKIFSFITSFAGNNKFLIAACIIALFIVLGCLSDPNVNIMLFVPMVLPLIETAGFDPVHMGICIIVTAMIGNITPPVGIVLSSVCSMEKLSFEKVSRALVPFIILLFAYVVILVAVPQLTLFLPNLLLG